jgi:hypothetical protein
MLPHRASYWKTTVWLLFTTLSQPAGAHFARSFGVLSMAVQLLLGLAPGSFLAMIGGMLCLYRDRRMQPADQIFSLSESIARQKSGGEDFGAFAIFCAGVRDPPSSWRHR